MANFVTTIVSKIKSLFSKGLPDVVKVATEAVELYDKALPYVKEAADANLVPAKVKEFFVKYGVPVEDELEKIVSGGIQVVEDDVKNYLFKAVTFIVQKEFGLTTTQAGLSTLLALLVHKFGG